MTLTRLPSGRRASQIGRGFVDAAADLADDALADVHQLGVVAETDVGFLDLAADFDVGAEGAVDHDVGDVVAGEQRLERAEAENVVADVLEQVFLLGDRHDDVLERDDVVDDVADFLARRLDVEAGELRQVDGVDQRREDGRLDVVEILRAADGGRRSRARGAAAAPPGDGDAAPGSRTGRRWRRRAPGRPAQCGAGGGLSDGGAGRRPATGSSAGGPGGLSPLPLVPRLPNINVPRYALYLPRSRASNGARPLRFWRLTSARPVTVLAIRSKDSAIGLLASVSAIIWPLLAAVPNKLGIERDDRERREAEGGGEVVDLDLGTLGEAALVDDQARRRDRSCAPGGEDRRGSWRCAGWRDRARR